MAATVVVGLVVTVVVGWAPRIRKPILAVSLRPPVTVNVAARSPGTVGDPAIVTTHVPFGFSTCPSQPFALTTNSPACGPASFSAAIETVT